MGDIVRDNNFAVAELQIRFDAKARLERTAERGLSILLFRRQPKSAVANGLYAQLPTPFPTPTS